MQPQIPVREVLTQTQEEQRDSRIRQGVNAVYQVAKAAYGPKAGNVLIEQSWGDPKLSRDGVTNVQKVFLEDHVSNMAARVIVQASKKNNQTVGDGTTLAVILASHFYNEARKLVAAGFNRMEVARKIAQSAESAVEQIEKMSKSITDEELLNVAKVSCGDDGLGELIADTVSAVGSESGVIVEEHGGVGVYNEIIDGFYMRKGFNDFRLVEDFGAMKSDFTNAPVLLLGKTITEGKEMRVILDKIVAAGHNKVLIMGDVLNEAMDVLVRRRVEGAAVPTLVSIPATAGMKTIALEDLAVLTGGTVYQDGQRAANFDISYLGAAERIIVEEFSTIIVGGGGEESAIKERLQDIESQLPNATSVITTNALKDRIARLRGKIGIIKVGAATEVDREELKLRVDDAVCALQAARRGGVVSGGGSSLARVIGTDFDSVFRMPFLELMDNAGDNGELKLGKLLESDEGFGYDLKDPTDTPINLLKKGVVDPTLVVTEAITNSASVASKLITVGATITFLKENK